MPTSSRFAVAVHVLTLLAWAGDEPLKSDYIAGSVNTNPVVIRRILCALAHAGLVTSQTGAAGGTRLARKAAEITLTEVYRAVEPRAIFALHRRPRMPGRHEHRDGLARPPIRDRQRRGRSARADDDCERGALGQAALPRRESQAREARLNFSPYL